MAPAAAIESSAAVPAVAMNMARRCLPWVCGILAGVVLGLAGVVFGRAGLAGLAPGLVAGLAGSPVPGLAGFAPGLVPGLSGLVPG